MDYGFDTTASRALDARLRQSLPGGNTRSITYYPPYPLALARGSGYRIWDLDGNEFIDLVNNYTALIHGHAAPAIVAALKAQAELGTAFPAPTELQAELAERIRARITSIERLRFTNSGSEANMAAVRVARAFTGRTHIVKAYEGYHGSWEQVPEIEAHDPGDLHTMLQSSGIPGAVWDLVHPVPYNDSAALEAVMREHGHMIAAIILEPVLFSGGVIAASHEFLRTARALADAHGALLILDEVVTMRLHHGGYQAALGVRPDLTTLGKIIGGGMPVGAVGGRADVMDLFNPQRHTFVPHSGTFNGNQMTMAAGCVSLDLLTTAEIERINTLGEQLAEGLHSRCVATTLPASVRSRGSLLQIDFRGLQDDRRLRALLHQAALGQGLYIAPRGMMNISTAMDEGVIARILAAFTLAIEQVAGARLAV
jgi:glutamate-1-semialdehyde 2,1-aminomutase